MSQEVAELIISYANEDSVAEFKKICLTESAISLMKIREDKDSTLLQIAIFAEAKRVFEYFIAFLEKHITQEELKAYINHENTQKVSAIHLASLRGNLKMIKTLIQYGANIFCVNTTGLNVVHYASQGNQPNSLAFFKEYHQMNIEERDKGEGTPLHWACYSGSEKAAFFLLDQGVNMNFVDKHGYTALHLAVIAQKTKIVKKLIQYGINYKIKDHKQMTALELAKSRSYKIISDFLSKAEKWNPCSFTAIIKKTKCNYLNIIIVVFTECFSGLCFFLVLFPCLWCRFQVRYHAYVYLGMTAVFFAVYLYLIFSNPGILVNKSDNPSLRELVENEVDLRKYCFKCLVENSENSKHCILCGKCIDGFDHHCFWVNNCIGKLNHKVFLFFLLLSALHSVVMLTLTVLSLIYSRNLSKSELIGYYSRIEADFVYLHLTQILVGVLMILLILFYLVELSILIKFNFKACFENITRTSNIGPLTHSFLRSSEINKEEQDI